MKVTRWARETLAGRLMLGQTIVLLASILTAGLIASIVGPLIFHDHLLQSGDTANSPELGHIENWPIGKPTPWCSASPCSPRWSARWS